MRDRGLIAAGFLLVALSTASLAAFRRPRDLPGDRPYEAPRFDDAALARGVAPIASYVLRATLDPALHTVRGKGTIEWTNASREPARELYLHLYLNAFRSDKTVFARFPGASGFRGLGAPASPGSIDIDELTLRGSGEDLWASADKTSPGDPDDATDIRVPLPSPVAPGAKIALEVAFTAKLPSIVLRTGFSGAFHMVGQWFPKIARREPDGRWAHFTFHHLSEFYADFGDYDVTLDTPSDMVIGATGALASETTGAGRTERRYLAPSVHDFAWTAWTGFRELDDPGDVAVRVLYPPGFEDAARVELACVRFGLDHFGRAYGAYPYPTLTVVHPPPGAEEAGGMEYPTLITTGGAWYLPRTGVHLLEGVTIHELGHQWFYGLVATNEHDAPFLDEGLNSFAEAEAMTAMFPDASGGKLFDLSVSLDTVDRLGALESAGAAPVALAASDFATGGDYANLVYRRTAAIVSTLAGAYGAERVRSALGRYTRRYRFAHPSPDDFVASMEESLGDEAARALRAALFDRARLDFAVSEIASAPDPSGEGFTGAALVRRFGELRLPVDVDLVGADGATQRVRWDGADAWTRLSYRGASPLTAAILDPEHRLLLDENLGNNALSERRAVLVGPLFDRLLFAAGAAFASATP